MDEKVILQMILSNHIFDCTCTISQKNVYIEDGEYYMLPSYHVTTVNYVI
jgi:hypothetical protein